MSTALAQTTKSLFSQQSIKARFEELLGKKAPGFITSVLQTVNNNKLLSKAEPQTVLTAAATAAILDLPINSNLGYAYIIPYNENRKDEKGKWQKLCVAQFQIGWKGLVQLALRTAQYKSINAITVYANQLESFNSLTEELVGDFSKDGKGEVIGYAAYFRLTTGFEKTVYWSKEKVTKHAQKYSKAFDSSHSPWGDKDQFDGMAMKTVLKNALSKWGILSIELQTAIQADQSVQPEEGKTQYLDNKTKSVDEINFDKERARLLDHINKSKTQEKLYEVYDVVGDFDLQKEYDEKFDSLTK